MKTALASQRVEIIEAVNTNVYRAMVNLDGDFLSRMTHTKQEILAVVKRDIADAAAPLATKSELRAAIAPLATRGELHAAIATAIAPLATNARVDALEKKMDEGFTKLGNLIEQTQHQIETVVFDGHKALNEKIDGAILNIQKQLNDHERRLDMLT